MLTTWRSWDISTSNKMQTKAELEDEIAKLRLRVAELEGQVEAFKLVIANLPQPLPYYPATDQWQWTFPNVVTTPKPFPATYNYTTE